MIKQNFSLTALTQEMDWLSTVIAQCFTSYFLNEGYEKRWTDIPLPDLSQFNCPYAQSVKSWELDIYDRLALALCIAPHVRPEALDVFFTRNQALDRSFTEFGGLKTTDHSGFLPTGQTLCFLITVNQPEMRQRVMELIGKKGVLMEEEVLILAETEPNIPSLNGQLSLNKNWFDYFLTGEHSWAEQSAILAAKNIRTDLTWEDVVLDDSVREQVDEIISWIQHSHTLMGDWGLARKLDPGYRALFYGSPGTGKTLTAALIGKTTGREVFRINLFQVVSKFIGETEKNLSRVFDTAQKRGWILFLDEADAIFGKHRTESSFNADLQNAYLLHRIEEFPGVVILSTHLNPKIDKPLAEKIQSVVQFPVPSATERLRLWKNAFSAGCTLDENIDLQLIAEKYELTGGAINNVLRYCALSVIRRNDRVVTENELIAAIERES